MDSTISERYLTIPEKTLINQNDASISHLRGLKKGKLKIKEVDFGIFKASF